MGNHTAGKAMGKTAELMLTNRGSLTALDILDAICEPWRSCDAEFESEDPDRPGKIHPVYTFYTDPNGPLGVLIYEAWGVKGKSYMETIEGGIYGPVATEEWHEGPYQRFRERYDFR